MPEDEVITRHLPFWARELLRFRDEAARERKEPSGRDEKYLKQDG